MVNNVFLLHQGNPGVPPVRVGKELSTLTDSTCDRLQNKDNGEDKEGMLVELDDLQALHRYTPSNSESRIFYATQYPAFHDSILIMNVNSTMNGYVAPDSGSHVDVTGILHFVSGTFRLCPRSAADIKKLAFPTGVGDGLSAKVEFSAFPNPARSTKISWSLPRKDDVELGVYDVLGRRAVVLARGKMPAGAVPEAGGRPPRHPGTSPPAAHLR